MKVLALVGVATLLAVAYVACGPPEVAAVDGVCGDVTDCVVFEGTSADAGDYVVTCCDGGKEPGPGDDCVACLTTGALTVTGGTGTIASVFTWEPERATGATTSVTWAGVVVSGPSYPSSGYPDPRDIEASPKHRLDSVRLEARDDGKPTRVAVCAPDTRGKKLCQLYDFKSDGVLHYVGLERP